MARLTGSEFYNTGKMRNEVTYADLPTNACPTTMHLDPILEKIDKDRETLEANTNAWLRRLEVISTASQLLAHRCSRRVGDLSSQISTDADLKKRVSELERVVELALTQPTDPVFAMIRERFEKLELRVAEVEGADDTETAAMITRLLEEHTKRLVALDGDSTRLHKAIDAIQPRLTKIAHDAEHGSSKIRNAIIENQTDIVRLDAEQKRIVEGLKNIDSNLATLAERHNREIADLNAEAGRTQSRFTALEDKVVAALDKVLEGGAGWKPIAARAFHAFSDIVLDALEDR